MATTVEQLINRGDRDRGSSPVLAGAKIPAGTMYFLTAAGFATNVHTGNKFGGIAIRTADNTSGANGDVTVEGWREGQFVLPGAGFTQAVVGDKINATDNFTTTTGAGIYIGKGTEFISATEVKVDIDALADA